MNTIPLKYHSQIKKMIKKARTEERERIVENLLSAKFYNPGITRWLKLSEEEILLAINLKELK